MSATFEFRLVSDECFAQTRTVWMEYAEANADKVSALTYEGFLHSCQAHRSSQEGDGKNALYGVFEQGNDAAAALVNVTHARPKSNSPWLKVLAIYVEPHLDVANAEPNIEKLAWIAATAVTGAIGLTYDEMPADEVKIWANVPMTKEFLGAVSTALFGTKFGVSSHGNWLVVTKNKRAA